MNALQPSVAQRGVSLVEMMVVLAICMMLTIGVFLTLSSSEARQRSATALDDTTQSGTHALILLDRMLRNAGSGFAQAGDAAYSCTLRAAKAGSQILPVAGALPAPFTGVNTGVAGEFHLAPVLIAPGQTTPAVSGAASDVLVIMGGSAGDAQVPLVFSDVPGPASLAVPNTVGLRGGDLLLIVEAWTRDCMVQQVAPSFTGRTAGALPLAGAYAAATVGTTRLAGYSDSAMAINLGNAAGGNPPSFSLVGVGDDNMLYAYPLLQTDAEANGRGGAVPLADSVFELHALYGVDRDGSGKLAWVSPSTDGYAPAALTAGTPEAAALLQSIKAVRLGLILRTPAPEKEATAPEALRLFGDLSDAQGQPLAYTRRLSEEERRYRYSAIESTIPLRNHIF